MGNQITNWVKTQSVGHGGAKAVLLCLADNAKDYERGTVTLSLDIIANTIEFDRRSVIRWMEKLEGKFIQTKRSRKGDGTNNANQYQILCPVEIFEPSDTQSPSEVTQVTESHYPSDRESLPEAEILPEIVEIVPNQVAHSHLEPSDTQSPITVLEEEEFKSLKEKDISYEISKKRNFTGTEKGQRLFEFWKKRMNSKKSVFTNDRKAKIKTILSKKSYADCIRAIIGCSNSSWHMGRDPDNSTLYNEFERIFKKAEETEKFINRHFQFITQKSFALAINGVHQNGVNQKNSTNQSARERRTENAINEFNAVEAIRQRVAERDARIS